MENVNYDTSAAKLNDVGICNLNTSTSTFQTYVNLPSEEEFINANQPSVLMFQMNKWSEPKYKCPKCNEGGMRKEEDIIYTSNPPCYRYECDHCGYSTFHHF